MTLRSEMSGGGRKTRRAWHRRHQRVLQGGTHAHMPNACFTCRKFGGLEGASTLLPFFSFEIKIHSPKLGILNK